LIQQATLQVPQVGDTDADEIDRASLAKRIATVFGQAAAGDGCAASGRA